MTSRLNRGVMQIGVFALALVLAIGGSTALAQSFVWTERQPAGDVDQRWWVAEVSSDGSTWLAGDLGGRLYTSTDSGANWIQRQPAGDADKFWVCGTVSSDGTKMAAAVSVGRLYTSTNSGADWTERQPAGDADRSWRVLAGSSDGTKLIVAYWPGRLYTSADSGASWTERQPAGSANKYWETVTVSPDGTTMLAGMQSGRLYMSSDSGVNWTEVQPAGDVDAYWRATASSADGTKLIAADYDGRFYTSANSGTSWTERQPAGDADKLWTSAASSADGTTLVAGVYSGRLYTSSDSGATWTEQQPAGSINKSWQTASCTADGAELFAGIDDGHLYTAGPPSAPTVTTAAVSNVGAETADCGGNVTDDGGANVTARGVCWSTSEDPTTDDDMTTDGSGTGSFTSSLTGMVHSTTYYLRAYATNSAGTAYGEQRALTTTAATLTVGASGCDFTTIQAAIDDSLTNDGDTISVEDAVHTEQGIAVDQAVTIQGHGVDSTIVQAHAVRGSATDRVFAASGSHTITFKDMTIRHGKQTSWGGAAIRAGGSTSVTVIRCQLIHNDVSAMYGGAVYVDGGSNTLTIEDSTITENTAERGAAIMSSGDVTISGSTLSANSTSYYGGAIYFEVWEFDTQTLSITNSTISDNTSSSYGGGLFITSDMGAPIVNLTNVTITGNHSDNDDSGGETGGGIYRVDGTVNLKNSLIANNCSGSGTGTADDIHGVVNSQDYNLIGATTGATITGTTTHNITGQDPLLDALADNGGPTLSHALQVGSPARNQIPNGVNGMGTDPLDVDQRGEARPALGDGDMGAYEAQTEAPKVTTAAVSNIGTETADCGGNVTADGGAEVTARGVCWSTSENPITDDEKTEDGTGSGEFTSEITGLAPGTHYYVRAYATNSAGTSYGADVAFTTSITVTTSGGTAAYMLGGDDAVVDPNLAIVAGDITDFKVSITGNFVGGDVLDYTGTLPGGVAGSYSGATGVLTFTGTASAGDWQTLLRTVTFSTNSADTATRTVAFTAGSAIPFDGNGHFYEYVASSIVWANAKTAAEGRSLYGLQGYLATITSQDENDFIRQKLQADAWIGGSDEAVEGIWRWVTGPESGTQFSEGSTPVPGQFANWNTGEPNNAGGEHYLEIYSTDGVGKWNDLGAANTLDGYVAEYGGMPGDPSPQITDTRDVTVTAPVAPTVTTDAVSDITTTTATCGGNVTADGGADVTARGVCWSKAADPTTDDDKTEDGTGTGAFTSSITNLSANTIYHVRAYATNSVGTSYGHDVEFTTETTTPTVTTADVSNVGTETADCGGNVTDDGGAEVTARGVCWTTTEYPTVDNNITTDGTGVGEFTSQITGLDPDTTYHVRAYATNSAGTDYGDDVKFTTSATTPTLTTDAVADITTTTATCTGTVTDDGGADVIARGACWNTTGTPTIADSKTTDGTGTGEFTSEITGLDSGTTYYVRAYATNNVGSSYGDEVPFTTTAAPPAATIPTVATADVSKVASNDARGGGEVVADGGDDVTTRGVCWSTSQDPTIADDKTTDGTGIGEYTSNLAGLSPQTTYYVRAYATNSVGTAYGLEVSFTTDAEADDDQPATPAPNLRVTVTAPTEPPGVGDDLTFGVHVQNVGDGTATGVVLTFPLPPNTEFISAWWITDQVSQAVPLDAYVEDGQIIIELGDIDPGEDLEIELVLDTLAPCKVTLTASAACNESSSPATAQADTDVDDTYWQVVNTITPLHACGCLGLLPLVTAAGLLSLKHGRRWRKCRGVSVPRRR